MDKQIFVFQSGKATGSGVIDLTLDDEDDGSSQGKPEDMHD